MISHQKKKFEGNDVIKKIITDQMFHHHNSNVRRQMYDWLKSDSLSSDVPNSIDHSQVKVYIGKSLTIESVERL